MTEKQLYFFAGLTSESFGNGTLLIMTPCHDNYMRLAIQLNVHHTCACYNSQTPGSIIYEGGTMAFNNVEMCNSLVQTRELYSALFDGIVAETAPSDIVYIGEHFITGRYI